MLNYTKIFQVVAEIGLQVYKSTQICVLTNLPIFAILQKNFCCNPHSNFLYKQSLGCLTSVQNFVDQSSFTPKNDKVE